MQMWFISNVACIEVYVAKHHLYTLNNKIVDEEIEDCVDLLLLQRKVLNRNIGKWI